MPNKVERVFRKWEDKIRVILSNATVGKKIGGDNAIFTAIGDYADYIKFISLFKAKKFNEAYEFYSKLDTGSSDNIPITIINWLYEETW